MKVFVASLAEDPDAALRARGPQYLLDAVQSAQPWFRWLAGRLITPDAVRSDPHAAVAAYLEAVASIDSETEMEEALATAADLSGLKLAAIRREQKKRGAVKRPAAAAKGGRPRNPYADMADEFAGKYMQDGVLTIRYFRGRWMRYRKGAWVEVSDDDLAGTLMTWIRRNHRDLSESRTLSNVTINLKATEMAHPLDDTEVPCWLDDTLTPAAGWMPVRNAIIHIPTILQSFDGDELVVGGDAADMVRPPTPRLFTPHALPYAFDPAATCPRWLDYLAGVQPDPEDRDVIRKMFGLLLTPEMRYNVFFVLQGAAGTGKSVMLHVLERLIGEANTCTVPLTKFEDEHYTHQLTENLLNSVDDMREVKLQDVEGAIKIATDGRYLDIRRQYHEGTRALVTARTVAACNELPRFYERSDALWERLRIICFGVKFRGTARQNKNLRHELTDELPGIFIWALRGLADLQPLNVFPEHTLGAALKEKHKLSCDPIGAFITDHFQASADTRLACAYIYDRYRRWAADGGYRAANRGVLNREVERIFGTPKVCIRIGSQVVQGFSGIGVIPGAFDHEPTSLIEDEDIPV